MTNELTRKKMQIRSLTGGRGIDYLLGEGHRILGHAISLFDTSYKLLAYNKNIVTDDRLWTELTTIGTFSQETVDFFRDENFINAFAESETVAVLRSDKLKYDRMNAKLFDKDDVQLGNINVLAYQKPFEEGDEELVELFSEILSKELQCSEFYKCIDRVYQESTLSHLLDGTPDFVREHESAVATLYDGLKNNIYVAAVDISAYDQTLTHLAYFRDMFHKIQPDFKYYTYLTCIVIILSTDEPVLGMKEMFGKLVGFFEQYNIYAGVSGVFQEMSEIRTHYREAINALNYGLKGGRKDNVFRYDDYRTERYLSSLSAAEIDKMQSPVIKLIAEHDAQMNTSLLKTLHSYILYGMNAAVTAEKTGITQEQLSSDIRLLEKLFDLDFTNGDTIFNLFISLKFMQ